MVGMGVLWLLGAQASVLINEFEPDPASVGGDSGYEWVELYNDGGSPIDLSGWTLRRATSGTPAIRFTFPGGANIPSGGYVVVGGEFVAGTTYSLLTGESLGFGNAGSSGDVVTLNDAAEVPVDTVIYGPDNADGFLDDSGLVASSVAPTPAAGVSLARLPNGADSNNSGVDFQLAAFPTPGASNDAATPSCDAVGAAPGLVINELVPDPAGADAEMEWVELHLPSGGTIDLSGWVITAGTSSYNSQSALPPGTSISGGGYLVVGQSGLIPFADVVAPGFTLGNAGSNADAVQLRDCFGNTVDTVVYGLDNTDGWLDDLGGFAALAPKPGSGESIARIPDGADSNNSANDFLAGLPTPGSSNSAPPPDCGGLASGLVINELLSNPGGPDDGLEWIELYHAGAEVLDLSGWSVQTAGSDSWSTKLTFGDGQEMFPGQHFLVGGEFVAGLTHPLTGSIGNGTGGDGARIIDCSGTVVDAVVYGGNNDDGVVDELGVPAVSIAPTPPEDGSIQRVEDGYDTDQSGLDFVVAEFPTPGSPNPLVEPILCEPYLGGVTINEILPDPDGVDDGLEFIELFNSTNEVVRLDGWSVSAGTSDYDDFDITLPGGTFIPPAGFFVIGGDLVPEATYTTNFSLGNGSSSRDGVRLFDCEGSTVDTVVYGVADEEDPDVGIVDDNDQLVAPYGDPGGSQALYRVADGVDTDAAEDWQLGRATPGETNDFDFGPGTDTDPIGGCGCGGGAPNGDAPDGESPAGGPPTQTSCSTVPAPLSVALFGLLVAGVRRRRLTTN